MPYALNIPSDAPEVVPEEYIPHLLSAIEGFLLMPDLWTTADYASGRAHMEQLKTYIVNCFGKCSEPTMYQTSLEIPIFLGVKVTGTSFGISAVTGGIPAYGGTISPNTVNNEVKYPFNAANGLYTVTVRGVKNTGFGIASIAVDGEAAHDGIDWYNASALNSVEATYPITVPTDGNHELHFKVASKRAAATAYSWHKKFAWSEPETYRD
jgi:hypothetical protein